MSAVRGAPPQGVPTLTEVVELGRGVTAEPAPVVVAESTTEEALPQAPSPPTPPPPPQPGSAAAQQLALLEAQLVERVYADVQRQVDLMLEYRMREVLVPVLERVSQALIADTRNELASTLRDVVSRAVVQELSRHRGR